MSETMMFAIATLFEANAAKTFMSNSRDIS